jgi:hypothetical protein
MRHRRRSMFALLFLTVVLAATPASGAEGTRCETELYRGHHGYPNELQFIVVTSADRGAVGVWEHHSRDLRMRVRVDAGDRREARWSELANRSAWDLVRCKAL